MLRLSIVCVLGSEIFFSWWERGELRIFFFRDDCSASWCNDESNIIAIVGRRANDRDIVATQKHDRSWCKKPQIVKKSFEMHEFLISRKFISHDCMKSPRK